MKTNTLIALCLAVFTLGLQFSCSENDPALFPSEEEVNPPSVDWVDYAVRGYKQCDMLDMVLIYQGGTQRLDWTSEQLMPYVVHTTSNKQKHWLFDSFLFLEFEDGKGHKYVANPGSPESAGKQEWEWLATRHFEQGKALLALEQTIRQAIQELGKPSFRHKIVIGLPEPNLNQTNWGELDGKSLDFTQKQDRLKAVFWYIDLLTTLFDKQGFENIELAGFYWIAEQMSTNYGITSEIGKYIRERGKKFYWIPYYHSNGFSQWREYGFDMAYLQPNYFFNAVIERPRLENACAMAYTHHMGLEMEFDGNALAGSPENKRSRLEDYIEAFEENDVYRNASIAYYEGGGAILRMSRSNNAADKEILDVLAAKIQERRERLVESVLYTQDFRKGVEPDKNIWTISGNKANIRPGEHGLIISSGGNITRLTTRQSISRMYGAFEVKARILAKDTAAVIKIHLLPAEEKLGAWPNSGELFMMKFEGKNEVMIRSGANTGKMNELNNTIKESVLYLNDIWNHFHVYECDWKEKIITFCVDGLKTNIQEDLFNKIYSDYPLYWPFNERFYLEVLVESPSTEDAVCIESVKIRRK